MKYQMELEVEIADNKLSFAKEFFKSISFVRKVIAITPENKPVKTKLSDKYEQEQSFKALIQELDKEFMPGMSAEEIIAELRESRCSGRTRIIEPL
jgi:hypothetical protein